MTAAPSSGGLTLHRPLRANPSEDLAPHPDLHLPLSGGGDLVGGVDIPGRARRRRAETSTACRREGCLLPRSPPWQHRRPVGFRALRTFIVRSYLCGLDSGSRRNRRQPASRIVSEPGAGCEPSRRCSDSPAPPLTQLHTNHTMSSLGCRWLSQSSGEADTAFPGLSCPGSSW